MNNRTETLTRLFISDIDYEGVRIKAEPLTTKQDKIIKNLIYPKYINSFSDTEGVKYFSDQTNAKTISILTEIATKTKIATSEYIVFISGQKYFWESLWPFKKYTPFLLLTPNVLLCGTLNTYKKHDICKLKPSHIKYKKKDLFIAKDRGFSCFTFPQHIPVDLIENFIKLAQELSTLSLPERLHTTTSEHPLLFVRLEERIIYLQILIHIATIDTKVYASGINALYKYKMRLQIDDKKFLSLLRNIQNEKNHLQRSLSLYDTLSEETKELMDSSYMQYYFLTEMLAVSIADGKLHDKKESGINEILKKLTLSKRFQVVTDLIIKIEKGKHAKGKLGVKKDIQKLREIANIKKEEYAEILLDEYQ